MPAVTILREIPLITLAGEALGPFRFVGGYADLYFQDRLPDFVLAGLNELT